MKRRHALKLVAFALGIALSMGGGYAGNYNPDTLKVALLPDENAATVIQDNRPLAQYLESRLGKRIDLVVTTDYSSMIEAMRFGRIDLAYFGPASYTIAKERMAGRDLDIEPFAARLKDGATTYQSVLIANAESGIERLEDIQESGVNVAFGDPASTSSHFAPKYTLMQAEVMPDVDYRERFLGAHDAVAVNVQRGNAAVGGLSRPIFESLVARGIVDLDKVRVLKYSDPIPQYPWVMRTDLKPAVQAAIREAFYGLSRGTPEGDAVLRPFKSDGFAEIADSDYDIIRAIRKAVPN